MSAPASVAAPSGVMAQRKMFAKNANIIRQAVLGPNAVRRGRQPLVTARAQVRAGYWRRGAIPALIYRIITCQFRYFAHRPEKYRDRRPGDSRPGVPRTRGPGPGAGPRPLVRWRKRCVAQSTSTRMLPLLAPAIALPACDRVALRGWTSLGARSFHAPGARPLAERAHRGAVAGFRCFCLPLFDRYGPRIPGGGRWGEAPLGCVALVDRPPPRGVPALPAPMRPAPPGILAPNHPYSAGYPRPAPHGLGAGPSRRSGGKALPTTRSPRPLPAQPAPRRPPPPPPRRSPQAPVR